MSIVLMMPPDLEAALTADAEALGRDPADLAVERLASWYDDYEEREMDDQPDPEAVEGIRRGLAAVAAGEEMPFEEYVTQTREKRRLREMARINAL